ncbi:MAG TPA: SDR family NAD(P)-dependent oxidoreductase, partial [Pyrinomonadaceae bacterium]|nr:SDR family NAD(P)-dependent oxidoreductase [Pyrinomonadaceae bacterium]
MSEKTFSGYNAVITGATRGIGRAIALKLAELGANVAFNFAKSREQADDLIKEIEGKGVKGFVQQCDVADTAAAADFIKAVTEAFGGLDLLVNNAGITRD